MSYHGRFWVYIMASKRHGTIYIGMTNDLARRAYEHREGLLIGFTKKYGCNRLVYFEEWASAPEAYHRERRLKHYKREWKISLIERENPDWIDLYPTLGL